MEKVNNVAFQLSEKQLTKQEILDFENVLNIKLPDDFINHYIQFNGGFPNANWSSGIKNVCPLFHLLSIKYGENTAIQSIKILCQKRRRCGGHSRGGMSIYAGV